jgi:alcohol dehydrogenase class IV
MGKAIGMHDLRAGSESVIQVADAIDAFFVKLGLKGRLREYGVPPEMLPRIVEFSMKNFNADRNRAFLNEGEGLRKTLQDAW